MHSASDFPLRALGIGELIERASAVFAQNFLAFALMALTVIGPYTVLGYVAATGVHGTVAQTVDKIEHPERHRKDPLPAATLELGTAAFVLLFLGSPFVAAGIAAGVSATYGRRSATYAQNFERVLPRWPRILGTACLQFCIVAGVAALCTLVIAAAAGIATLTAHSAPLVALLFVVISAALSLGVALLMLPLIMTYGFSICGAALEPSGVSTIVANAYRRIFAKSELGKAMLIALAYVSIDIGVIVVNAIAGGIVGLAFKSDAAQFVVNAVISSIGTAFLAVLIAVYYLEVRTRSEALDIENDIAQLDADDEPAERLDLEGEPAYASTAYASGRERGVIRRFLERRDVLEPAPRRALAAALARRVRPRVPEDLARLDDESLLERL